MKQKTDIHAVEMVRRIRDRQAALLRGRSDAEIITYFRKAGKLPRKRASWKGQAANKGIQPQAREGRRG